MTIRTPVGRWGTFSRSIAFHRATCCRAEQAIEEVRQFSYALARWTRALAPGILIIIVSGYFYPDDAAIQEALASGSSCKTRVVSVTVGMAVTGHPPYGPVLAALPHTVLTSDVPPYGGGVESRVWKVMNHVWNG